MAVYDDPTLHMAAITPHATTVIPRTTGIYVGGVGDVEVVTADGDTVIFVGCPVGLILPIRVTRVLAANTTATNLVAMW